LASNYKSQSQLLGRGLMSEPVQPVRGGNVAPAIEQAARTPRLSIPLRDFWWAALVLLGVSAGAVAWTIWELRSDAFRAAIAESGNIAAVLASQLSRSIYGIDSVLIETKRATRDLDIDTPASFRYAFNAAACTTLWPTSAQPPAEPSISPLPTAMAS
jgi:hypothetical protein